VAWGIRPPLGGNGMGERGQSTLEWVIGAAVILGTPATQRDHPSNHGAATQFQIPDLAQR
jgi:hypothetical protein